MATPSARAPKPDKRKGRAVAAQPLQNSTSTFTADTTSPGTPQCPAGHTIVIEREPFGCGYDVKIVPPAPGFDFDKEWPDYRFARSYARSIRLHRDWPIDDRTGEAL